MKKVDSSNIDSIKHNNVTNTLEVTFKNGKVYHYSNVSQHTYNIFEKAPSLGKHLYSHIAPYHKYSVHTKKK